MPGRSFLLLFLALATSASAAPLSIASGEAGTTTAAEVPTILGAAPLSGATFTGSITAPAINAVLNADSFAGSDIGQKINNAVSACPAFPIGCTISVQKSGTISTPPVLPTGTKLVFNPTGTYALDANWVIAHRGVTVDFGNAPFTYALDNGTPAIYVGKNIASTVSISGSTVTWVSGGQFSSVDAGDQIQWCTGTQAQCAAGTGVAAANVAGVTSPTSITLTAPVTAISKVPATFGMVPDTALGANPGQTIVLIDLHIIGTATETNASDVGLRLELVSSATVRGLTVSNLGRGTCLSLRGTLSTDFYDVRCQVDGSGIVMDQNNVGGLLVTGSNANRFFGVDLVASNDLAGWALLIKASSLNAVYGAHVEGNVSNHPAVIQGSIGNSIHLVDWERNGSPSAIDVTLDGAPNTVIYGPAQFESLVSPTGISLTASPQVRIQDLMISGSYSTGFNSLSGSTGQLVNVSFGSGERVGTTGFIVENQNGLGNLRVPGTITAASVKSSSAFELAATTARLGGVLLTPGCHNQSAIRLTGAATSMACVMSGAGGTQPTNIQASCFVSAADTVVPQLCTAVSTTPTAQAYNIRVVQ
jgi:hypothetical protein